MTRRAVRASSNLDPPSVPPIRYAQWLAHIFDRPERDWYFPDDPAQDVHFAAPNGGAAADPSMRQLVLSAAVACAAIAVASAVATKALIIAPSESSIEKRGAEAPLKLR